MDDLIIMNHCEDGIVTLYFILADFKGTHTGVFSPIISDLICGQTDIDWSQAGN